MRGVEQEDEEEDYTELKEAEWEAKRKQYLPDVKKRNEVMSEDGMYLYYFGIIDYLQEYNLNKQGENFLKSIYKNGELISAVAPDYYSMRYINFM